MGAAYQTDVTQGWGDWDSVSYELPSENDHNEATTFEKVDWVEGPYQWQITNISPAYAGRPRKDGSVPERRGITFTAVAAPVPSLVGKEITQWYNVTSHPQGNLYPIFKAAAGGYLDPNVKPRLADLKDKQITAVIVKERGKEDPSKIYDNFQAILPAQNYIEPVPF